MFKKATNPTKRVFSILCKSLNNSARKAKKYKLGSEDICFHLEFGSLQLYFMNLHILGWSRKVSDK